MNAKKVLIFFLLLLASGILVAFDSRCTTRQESYVCIRCDKEIYHTYVQSPVSDFNNHFFRRKRDPEEYAADVFDALGWGSCPHEHLWGMGYSDGHMGWLLSWSAGLHSRPPWMMHHSYVYENRQLLLRWAFLASSTVREMLEAGFFTYKGRMGKSIYDSSRDTFYSSCELINDFFEDLPGLQATKEELNAFWERHRDSGQKLLSLIDRQASYTVGIDLSALPEWPDFRSNSKVASQ
ncbi:MAG: hypothetical protein WA705_06720 [Candidatus Ozemobacteraceae bacterium]